MTDMLKVLIRNVKSKKISIFGHWDSAEYSKGYKEGRKDGVRACELFKKDNKNRS